MPLLTASTLAIGCPVRFNAGVTPVIAQTPGTWFLTPDELRVLLVTPSSLGNREEFLDAIVGSFTKEEADALERRINALNEQVDEVDEPRL